MTRATSLSLMALKSACKLLAATSVNLTPQQVYERLGAWWNDTGAKLLSGAQVGDASPEVPDAPEQDLQYDDAWGEDMEEVDLVKADEHGASDAVLEHDPNAAKLVRAEGDLTAWKEIEVLAKDLDADVAPPAVVEDGKDENLTDACTDTGDQVPTNPGHGWWASGVAISVWHKPRRRCMLAPCGIPAQADQGLCYSASYK